MSGNVRANGELNQNMKCYVLKMICSFKARRNRFEENETDFFLKFNPKEDFSSSLFSPKHNLTLPEMPMKAIENIIHTWQKNI
jgi:UDPglucose--hexose-1-phosphate uridylyltransferase